MAGELQADGEKRRRRRGRRGGRRSRHGRDGEALPQSADSAPQLQAEDGMHHGEARESEPEPRDLVHPEMMEQETLQHAPAPSRERADEQRNAYQRDDGEPSVERHQPEPAPYREPASAAPVPPERPAPAPRRGSTVREPVPTAFNFGGETSTPAPLARVQSEPPEQPAPAGSSESEDAAAATARRLVEEARARQGMIAVGMFGRRSLRNGHGHRPAAIAGRPLPDHVSARDSRDEERLGRA